jgi:hypothetical protein
MRLVQLRAPKEEDAACLLRELAVYAPKRLRGAILIEFEERSTSDLLALLSAIETCIAANAITSVRIELDGRKYTLASR